MNLKLAIKMVMIYNVGLINFAVSESQFVNRIITLYQYKLYAKEYLVKLLLRFVPLYDFGLYIYIMIHITFFH